MPVAEIVGGVVGLLLIAAFTLALTKRIRMPFTVALVLTGIALASLGRSYPDQLGSLVDFFGIQPELIFFVFLPTLIFESAFNLDARQLKRNLGAVIMLAVPGLLISTFVIGGIIALLTGTGFASALLLGAILSATDPVAVIALFKQLGAPRRLTILVEGESLFNDASSMVVAKVILGVIAAGTVSGNDISHGIISFFVLFLGGSLVGWLMGLATGWLLGKVESDPLIEITLTTVLAYLSFLIAEEVLHLSGIMAVVGAGLAIGGVGKMKISPSVRQYLENFWEYMAFIANALIFLMVGLRIGEASMAGVWYLLLIAIGAMIVSRALVIYGLLPVTGMLRGEEPVTMPYRTVMFWGGLRGAIAIAIVLSLDESKFAEKDLFTSVVMGCVLFTLLVQGLTIQPLMHKLGLDIPPLTDRLARIEVDLAGKLNAQERINELMQSGFFSGPIGDKLGNELADDISKAKDAIDKLRAEELDEGTERRLLFMRCLAEEKALYIDMFNHGHISEKAFRELSLTVDTQIDSAHYHGNFMPSDWARNKKQQLGNRILRLFDKTPVLMTIAERIRRSRVAMDYEEAWGHFMGSTQVLEMLKETPDCREAEEQYRQWQQSAAKQLDHVAEQFPEFFNAMQERLGRRMALLAEDEATESREEHGALSHGAAEEVHHHIAEQLRRLRGFEVTGFTVDPAELLRKVPFFRHISPERFSDLAAVLQAHTFAEGDAVIKQGAPGDSLFIIARGVVRVSREDENGNSTALATLVAGDFFGEMALLRGEKRNATVRMATPGTLYELARPYLDQAMETFPRIREALEKADRERGS